MQNLEQKKRQLEESQDALMEELARRQPHGQCAQEHCLVVDASER